MSDALHAFDAIHFCLVDFFKAFWVLGLDPMGPRPQLEVLPLVPTYFFGPGPNGAKAPTYQKH